MGKEQLISFDGELVPAAEAKINVLTPAVRFAAHVFEGIRAYWSGEHEELYVFRLTEHLERLQNGMKVMRYERIPTLEEMAAQVLDCIRANGHRHDIGIRLSAYVLGEGFMDARGPISLMCATEPGAKKTLAEKKISTMISSWRRIDDNAMPGRLKSAANYQNGRLGLMQARDAGYDEAIFLTHDGKVSEGAGACIYMIRHGQPTTPPVTAGILESVTRDTLMHLFREKCGLETVERPIDRTELYIAEEVFFCGSAYEIHPITSIDDIQVADGEIGPLTAAAWEHYEALVRGAAPDHAEWRTPVYGGQDKRKAAE